MNINLLTELLNQLRNRTPGSQNWYQTVSRAVELLLEAELERIENETPGEIPW